MPIVIHKGLPCTPPNVNGYLFQPADDPGVYFADVREADLGRFCIGAPDSPFTVAVPGYPAGDQAPAGEGASAPEGGPSAPDGDGGEPSAEALLAAAGKIQKKADLAAWAVANTVAVVLDPESQTRDAMLALIAEALAARA